MIELADGHNDAETRYEEDGERRVLERALLRKVDLRMSFLVFIYILNYMDRSSAAAARLRGFEDNLGLDGTQFATVLSVFYVGYVLMQIPSNMLLSQIDKPSVYLSSCTIIWGFVSFLTGAATNYYEVLIARTLLGFVEAVFFPGALFFLSRWYKRSELSERTAFLICGNLLSSSFGVLIASAILDMMDGVFGLSAWRWLFFVEGGFTILAGVAALVILPDFPEFKQITWLTPAEHALAKQRMIEDAVDTPPLRGDAMSGLKLAFLDWKVWYLAITLLFCVVSTSFTIYFPTLTATMGYSTTISLLLCAPPWLVAAMWSLWVCRHSDKTGERCMHIVVPIMIAIGGFLLSMSTMNIGIRYASLFLMTQSSCSAICFYAWASSTVSNPPAKRAVALALINAVSQCGNIVGSYVWVKEWGPTYAKSYAICGMTYFICAGMCLRLRSVLRKLNREFDLEHERGIVMEGQSSAKGWRYHT
ncbi:hypothetical protein AN958_00811 [Leucoagaricus sp. SymC.cos]|nr:hypothetical protein AN958_00811 [Leucoagaricus sp. SymC.cos]